MKDFKVSLEFSPRFHEIDRYGILHHSVYFCWFECGRIALMEKVGIHLEALHREGYQFVVSELKTKFRGSVRPGMQVRLVTSLINRPLNKLTFRQCVIHSISRELLVEAQVELVALKAGQLQFRLPEAIVSSWFLSQPEELDPTPSLNLINKENVHAN